MAVTHGHGNPSWTRDETILALNLYFECEGKIPGSSDKRVIELSNILRNHPFHKIEVRKESFRNPSAVAFKLQNIRSVATGVGFDNTSKMDKLVWNELGSKPEFTKELSSRIVSGMNSLNESDIDTEDTDNEEMFFEGRIITELHRRRERSQGLRRKLINKREKSNQLMCDICGISSYWNMKEASEGIFECHHIIPLTEGEIRPTTIADIALLCANCHRAIHRLIAKTTSWISIKEAKTYLISHE